MKERLKKGFLILIIGIFLSSCVSLRSQPTPNTFTNLELADYLKFTDLPLPGGFKLLEKESFAFQNDLLRVALLKYKGRATAEQLLNFYQEQMPLYGWSLINIVEYDQRVLNFEKGDEICIITIQIKGKTANVIISLSPRSKPKIEKEIKK